MFKLNFVTGFLRLFLLLISGAVAVNGLVLCITTNFNLGNILTLGLGVVLLTYSLKFDLINQKTPFWLKTVFIIGFTLVLAFASFLLIYGTTDTVDYKEDAVIVLGAAVHKDVPSLALKDRLDTAAEYYQKNPDAVIVVSGGKGPQETVTEAQAMEEYLIEKGVPKTAILKEEKATSTYENFVYSKEILDGLFGGEYNVAFISNDYHIYRAKGIAETAGIDSITHINSSTRWHTVLSGTLRECVAVMKFWVFGS